jgi:hypothetical protein
MRKSTLSFLIIIGVAVLIGSGGQLRAQSPPLSVTIEFLDGNYYDYGTPIRTKVTLTNTSTGPIYIKDGYSSLPGFRYLNLFLYVRLIDPAGRVLLPLPQIDMPVEAPDAGPLPFVLDNNNLPVQAALCEVLGSGQNLQQTDDLTKYYEMKLPGYYSARVELSAMTFIKNIGNPEPACDINKYDGLGVVKSETKYIYAQGHTEVNIIPQWWVIEWKDGKYLIDDIAVTIWPEVGKTVDDYSTTVLLNNLKAKKVVKMYSILRKQNYLLALFDKRKAINSLGPVAKGNWYSVVISGMLKTNQFFGGGQQVKIISYKDLF